MLVSMLVNSFLRSENIDSSVSRRNLASATRTLHGGVGVFIEQGFFRCFHLQDHTRETLCERVVDITRQTGALFEDGSLALLLGDLLPMNSNHDVLRERLS